MSAKHTDKRKAILEATFRLVSEKGLHATPMSAVAAEAGVGAGTIYRYFKNKDALIIDLYIELKTALAGDMLAAMKKADGPEETFAAIWLAVLDHGLAHPQELLFMEQFANSPLKKQACEETLHKLFAPMGEFFETMRNEGIIKDLPMEMIKVFTFDPAFALIKGHISGDYPVTDTVREQAVSMCWDALRP